MAGGKGGDAEVVEGSVGRQGSERVQQRATWFSVMRTLRLFACTCAVLWFLFILVILPSAGLIGLPPLTREVLTSELLT
jgi:hypothetical protein